jgi:hypothetical protein
MFGLGVSLATDLLGYFLGCYSVQFSMGDRAQSSVSERQEDCPLKEADSQYLNGRTHAPIF